MTKADPRALAAVADLAEDALQSENHRPVIIGVCGAQGSGKTTLAETLVGHLRGKSIPSASLSLDDLYLTRRKRLELAENVHPLFAIRGVPGTHDIDLGLQIVDALRQGLPAALPRFEKLADERAPPERWDRAPANCQVLFFEGWCIGARPQSEDDLREPVNALEALEDREGAWRAYANDCLAGEYQRLFARIDRLALLAAPSFDIVYRWRLEQENELRNESRGRKGAPMDPDAMRRFVSHYERLTRHILTEMPSRADLLIDLDEQRRPKSITRRETGI